MSTMSKVQLAAALVATFGFCTAGAVNAADKTNVAEKQAPSKLGVKIAQADADKAATDKPAKKEKKASTSKKAAKGGEGSCKGKEGSCKGKDAGATK